jgi:hypothetical protein
MLACIARLAIALAAAAGCCRGGKKDCLIASQPLLQAEAAVLRQDHAQRRQKIFFGWERIFRRAYGPKPPR